MSDIKLSVQLLGSKRRETNHPIERGNNRRGLPTMLTLGLKGSVEISSL